MANEIKPEPDLPNIRKLLADLRPLVGPLHTISAAAQLCVGFKAARVTCRPVKFEGEQLAQR